MPVKQMPAIQAWSFSKLERYDGCPFKLYQEDFCGKKLKDDQKSPALVRGKRIDEGLGAYLLHQSLVFPDEAKSFAEELKMLRKMGPKKIGVQGEWAFTREWTPCDWMAHDVWVRIKVDLHFDKLKERHIWDWKTGKIRPASEEQMRLYCLAGHLRAPKVAVVHSKLAYVDQGEEKDSMLVAGDVEKEKKYWIDRIKPMMTDRVYRPKPSNACRWCHLSKEKGGPCPY